MELICRSSSKGAFESLLVKPAFKVFSLCHLALKYYLVLAPEQAKSPLWIFSISVGEECPWQHIPSRVLPPACVPLTLRSDSRALVTCL